MKQLPIGIDDFKKIIENEYEFVDKSLFIKDIVNDSSEVILITRPRRFGKTINMSMLYYYFSNTSEVGNTRLFDDLLISQHNDIHQKHYHQYPVIFITFKDVKSDNYEDALGMIKYLISNLYSKFRTPELLNKLSPAKAEYFARLADNKSSDITELKTSLVELTAFLELFYNKQVIVLIDEYDTPVHAAYNHNYFPAMINFLSAFFSGALKGNNSLEKAVITGITKVAQASIFSGLNNFTNYSILDQRYGEYFGFTPSEVDNLLKNANHASSSREIKTWYNGYNIGGHTLYNPWSILNCLKYNFNLKPYWLNTADNSIIKKLIRSSKGVVKDKIIELMQGNTAPLSIAENLVFQDLDKNEEAIWALLLYSGYLTMRSQARSGRRLIAELAIPNEEVLYLYDEIVEHWFGNTLSLAEYDLFIASLASGDLKTFEAILTSYISTSSSYFDFNTNTKEQVFHSLILGLVLGLRHDYIIKSNQEAGSGRFDVALIPKNKANLGIMIELKTTEQESDLDDAAKTALTQIENKKYTHVFIEHEVKNIMCLGLAFCGKRLKLASDKIAIG